MNEVEQEEMRNRDIAKRLAARAELLDVRLLKVLAELESQPTRSNGLAYSVNSDVEVEYEDGDSHFVVSVTYNIDIEEPRMSSDDEAESGSKIAGIRFTQAALYALDMREDESWPAAEEMGAFGATTGQFALYPYAREFVSSMSMRLGLPALTLPMFKLATNSGDKK